MDKAERAINPARIQIPQTRGQVSLELWRYPCWCRIRVEIKTLARRRVNVGPASQTLTRRWPAPGRTGARQWVFYRASCMARPLFCSWAIDLWTADWICSLTDSVSEDTWRIAVKCHMQPWFCRHRLTSIILVSRSDAPPFYPTGSISCKLPSTLGEVHYGMYLMSDNYRMGSASVCIYLW